MPSYNRALHALRTWLDSWAGIGRIAAGMARQGYDLQLTRYDERGWRATFYTTGMEHSPTSAIATRLDRQTSRIERGQTVQKTMRKFGCVLVTTMIAALMIVWVPPAFAKKEPAPVPQTGQTTSFAPGDDGDIQAGVPLPTPRFTDNQDGTVTDNLTGLIWLKNANCPQIDRDWPTALADVASLNAVGTMNGHDCGDTSNRGTHQTDWRLPNIRELLSLVHFAFSEPCLSNTVGTGKWAEGDAFTEFLPNPPHPSTRWSSTANSFDRTLAWVVDFDGLSLVFSVSKTGGIGSFVTAVRGQIKKP
jgi:Protein of unknown function (DUF1566)